MSRAWPTAAAKPTNQQFSIFSTNTIIKLSQLFRFCCRLSWAVSRSSSGSAANLRRHRCRQHKSTPSRPWMRRRKRRHENSQKQRITQKTQFSDDLGVRRMIVGGLLSSLGFRRDVGFGEKLPHISVAIVVPHFFNNFIVM